MVLPCRAGRAGARYGKPLETDDPLREKVDGRLPTFCGPCSLNESGSFRIFVGSRSASDRHREFELAGRIDLASGKAEEDLVALVFAHGERSSAVNAFTKKAPPRQVHRADHRTMHRTG